MSEVVRPRKGERAVAVVMEEGDYWPMGNLHRDGCKHDVLREQESQLRVKGQPAHCAKCGAILLPEALVRALHDEIVEYHG